ncbi:MAG TPA: hypothetical protein VH349_04720 [Ktedonobacterales bacterium]|jgi:hypothetical protein
MKRTVITGAMKVAQTPRITAADAPASPQTDETRQGDQERATASITAKTGVGTQARVKAATTATSSATPSGKPLPPLPVVISGAKKEPAQRAVGWKSFFVGRRSRTARVTLWTVAAVAAFVFLIGATPLGQASPLGGTFQAYAQSVPWVAPPTATPKPYVPPRGANPGQQAIIDKITAVFGSYAPGAINVARCESGFDPNARNTIAIGGSHASGVFQILYPSTWNGTSYASYSPYDADANIHAAYEIFRRDGYSWREWACKP